MEEIVGVLGRAIDKNTSPFHARPLYLVREPRHADYDSVGKGKLCLGTCHSENNLFDTMRAR